MRWAAGLLGVGLVLVAGASVVAPPAQAATTGSIAVRLSGVGSVPLSWINLAAYPSALRVPEAVLATSNPGTVPPGSPVLLNDLPPGRYVIEASVSSLDTTQWYPSTTTRSKARSILVRAGETSTVGMTLKGEGRLKGEILTPQGIQRNGFIGIHDEDGLLLEVIPTDRIRVGGQLAHLVPGRYRVSFAPYETAPKEWFGGAKSLKKSSVLTVRAGRTADLRLKQRHVKVIRARNKPSIRGALVADSTLTRSRVRWERTPYRLAASTYWYVDGTPYGGKGNEFTISQGYVGHRVQVCVGVSPRSRTDGWVCSKKVRIRG